MTLASRGHVGGNSLFVAFIDCELVAIAILWRLSTPIVGVNSLASMRICATPHPRARRTGATKLRVTRRQRASKGALVNLKVTVEDVTRADSSYSIACLCYIGDTAGGWDIHCPRRRGRTTLPDSSICWGGSNTRLCAQHENTNGLMELPKSHCRAYRSCMGPGGQ